MKHIKNLILYILVNIAALYTASELITGIDIMDGYLTSTTIETLLTAAVIFSFIHIFVKPVMRLLSIPLMIISFGSFIFVINAVIFIFVGIIVPEYSILGFMPAFAGSIIVSFIHILTHWITHEG